MPKAYWIGSHMTVKDADKMKAYAEAAGPAIAAHGGKFLARGVRTASLEGPEQTRVVVTEFPNFEAAVGCYNSDAYQAALAKLDGGVDRSIYVVEAPE
ncbi:MAG: DUF1330 domain-containing protein [Rhodospirillaceae bacterium]